MKKILYTIGYQALKLRAKLMGLPLKYIAKDYFILGANVIELKGLFTKYCFSYHSTVMFITGTKFFINAETVIDIDNGIRVLFHGDDVRPNVAGYIIGNKQYDSDLNIIDEGELYMVMYNFIVTTYKKDDGTQYKIMNLKGDELYSMFHKKEQLKAKPDGDYVEFSLGKHTKKIHITGIKQTVEEI